MALSTITEIYRELQSMKSRIHHHVATGGDVPDDWYDAYDILIDDIIATEPRNMQETVLVANVMMEFCQEFIGEREQHMARDEKRMVSLVSQLQHALYQLSDHAAATQTVHPITY